MKIKFESEEVEVDGIAYDVCGTYDPDTEEAWDLHIFSSNCKQEIQTHLMDSVVEDIMSIIIERYAYKSSSDEFFDHADGEFEEEEDE